MSTAIHTSTVKPSKQC